MVYEFLTAAFPWLLTGLFLAVFLAIIAVKRVPDRRKHTAELLLAVALLLINLDRKDTTLLILSTVLFVVLVVSSVRRAAQHRRDSGHRDAK